MELTKREKRMPNDHLKVSILKICNELCLVFDNVVTAVNTAFVNKVH